MSQIAAPDNYTSQGVSGWPQFYTLLNNSQALAFCDLQFYAEVLKSRLREICVSTRWLPNIPTGIQGRFWHGDKPGLLISTQLPSRPKAPLCIWPLQGPSAPFYLEFHGIHLWPETQEFPLALLLPERAAGASCKDTVYSDSPL